LFDGDYPLMPYFVIPGVLALVVGFVLLGLAVLRATVLLIVGTLAMLGFNDQNAQVLMAIPFGIAWVAAGYVFWSGKGEPIQQPARVR
jgi:hypothetical protein